MAYKKGELTIKEDEDGLYDARSGPTLKRAACLPHSCDYWVIGGVDEIKVLIDDLVAAFFQLAESEGRREAPSPSDTSECGDDACGTCHVCHRQHKTSEHPAKG